MKIQFKTLVITFILVFIFSLSTINGMAADQLDSQPVVRAVLFYSPTCGHCHLVITEVFPPLTEKYGSQLQIIGINIATKEGSELYQNFLTSWGIPEDRYGVPTLVVSDVHLVGSGEIPEQFPGIVEEGLSQGGYDWPEIPGMDAVITQADQSASNQNDPTPENTPDNQTASETNQENDNASSTETLEIPFDQEFTVWDRFQMDLAGNILAVVVLIGMIISVIWVLVSVLRPINKVGKDWSWVIPILSVLGLFVAGYLSFVEVTKTEAVCGPVGDCNSVQESPYAWIFGILPVGILGLLGYVGITFAWIMKNYGPERWQNKFTLLMWGMTLFGVVFSIYLTYLEPFVIGATCAWCVSSAVIITIQFLAATGPVRQLWMDE